jgi:hypothetical protein
MGAHSWRKEYFSQLTGRFQVLGKRPASSVQTSSRSAALKLSRGTAELGDLVIFPKTSYPFPM